MHPEGSREHRPACQPQGKGCSSGDARSYSAQKIDWPQSKDPQHDAQVQQSTEAGNSRHRHGNTDGSAVSCPEDQGRDQHRGFHYGKEGQRLGSPRGFEDISCVGAQSAETSVDRQRPQDRNRLTPLVAKKGQDDGSGKQGQTDGHGCSYQRDIAQSAEVGGPPDSAPGKVETLYLGVDPEIFNAAVPYYFCMVNAAAFLGVLSLIRGERLAAWTPRQGLEG